MATYLVSGAGTTAANGTYAQSGIHDEVPVYVLGSTHRLKRTSGSANWVIELIGGEALYRNATVSDTPPLSGWVQAGGSGQGQSPAPTVALGTHLPTHLVGAQHPSARAYAPLADLVLSARVLLVVTGLAARGRGVLEIDLSGLRCDHHSDAVGEPLAFRPAVLLPPVLAEAANLICTLDTRESWPAEEAAGDGAEWLRRSRGRVLVENTTNAPLNLTGAVLVLYGLGAMNLPGNRAEPSAPGLTDDPGPWGVWNIEGEQVAAKWTLLG